MGRNGLDGPDPPRPVVMHGGADDDPRAPKPAVVDQIVNGITSVPTGG